MNAVMNLLTVLWILIALLEAESFPRSYDVEHWADNLSKLLEREFVGIVKLKRLKNTFENEKDPISVVEKEDFKLVKTMAEKIGALLQKKTEALKRLVEEAEKLARNVPYNPEIRKEEVEEYINVNKEKEINFNKSGIHIPVEIWEEDKTILNAIHWSSDLESIFKDNLKRDPSIKWQYFASESGMLRIFPSPVWPKHDEVEVDLFDIRRRPWYIQATVDPKDIIVLIDVSGSMHGKALDIMKIAVKSFLNSLNENDYINVAWYTDTVGWVSCLEGLVQANNINKRILFDGIERVKEENSSNYEVALEFGFTEFQKFQEEKANGNRSEWEGADCHKMIVIFSDGGTELPIHVLNKYKEQDATAEIRVFTYAVGPHPIPIVTLQDMACNTSGGFDVFITPSQARYSMRELVKVLSRPLVLTAQDKEGDERMSILQNISSPYQDFLDNPDMILTISMPVLNRTDQNETVLLGVMGIDVNIEELVNLTPWGKLPPSSYPFIINSNGHVLYHPYMKTQYGFYLDPPDVDISELEGTKLQMRNQLVQGEVVEVIEKSAYFTANFTYLGFQKYDVSSYPVPHWPFRVALATPNTEDVLKLEKDPYPLTVKDYMFYWGFCSQILSAYPTATVVELSELLQHSNGACDEEIIRRIFWDSKKIDDVSQIWRKEKNPKTKFLLTSGGLGITVPYSEMPLIENETNPRTSKLFTRSASTDNLMITRIDDDNIAQMKRIQVTAEANTATVAVVGFVTSVDQFFENVSRMYQNCSSSDQYTCYLIDDGGFIFYSSEEHGKSEVGMFLGEVDSWLFDKLLNESVYESFRYVDHRALCPIRTHVSSANKLNSFLTYLLHNIFNPWTWESLGWWLTSFLMWSPAAGLSELNLERRDGLQACTQQKYYFYVPDTMRNVVEGKITCDDCQRHFSAARINKTNLMLVIAENPCTCTTSPHLPPFKHVRLEKEEEENLVCSTDPLPRMSSQRCYRFHPDEEPKPRCKNGASKNLFTSKVCVVLALVVALATM